MSLRTLLALLLSGSLAVAVALIYFFSHLLEKAILSLLPAKQITNNGTAIHLLIMDQFIAVAVFIIVITVLIFIVLSVFIVGPLRKLAKVMTAFAADGTSLPAPKLSLAPTEVKELNTAFASFEGRVAEAHKKDTEISRVKSDFISTAAHQLRTPLTGIRWALEALEKENLSPDQKALVKSATDKSHDLVAIVGTLLDISSIESGKYKYNFELLDVSVLVAEVAQDFVPLAQKSNIQLTVVKSAAFIPSVRIDRERIKWVLNNLVENAIRYTPAPGTVHLSTEIGPGVIFVRVRDSGIGIDPKDRGNIFERFYRAGNAITKENQGNGLGLYIARTIATDHGGDLNFVENKDGPGTTFVLSLPVGKPEGA